MNNSDDKPSEPPAARVPIAPPVPSATPPAAAALALSDPVEKAQRRARLLQVAGPGQLHAAVLALLLTQGRAREMAVWRDENRHTVGAKELRNELIKLHPSERVPWLEKFIAKVALEPPTSASSCCVRCAA